MVAGNRTEINSCYDVSDNIMVNRKGNNTPRVKGGIRVAVGSAVVKSMSVTSGIEVNTGTLIIGSVVRPGAA